MDFSQLNLQDILGQAAPASESEGDKGPESESTELPKLDPKIQKQLDALDPLDIVNYLKVSEILPPDFEMPKPEGEMASTEGEQPEGGFSDVGLADMAEAPAPTPA